MEIRRTEQTGVIELGVGGRLDGYWADHLESAIADVIREGHHHIRLDLVQTTFLSSAGIAVLMKFHKQLSRIDGSLSIVRASTPVRTVLDMTRLSPVLMAPEASEVVTAPMKRVGRPVEHDGTRFEVFELGPQSPLTCRVLGSDEPLRGGAFREEQCTSLGSLLPTFAVGIGAFGQSFDDCRARFGELISVTGATGYQPADGTNVPDYLVAAGVLADDVRLLYGLACEGSFSMLARFEATPPGSTVGLTTLLEGCLRLSGHAAMGVVVIAEAAGLVGAALRRSPAQPPSEEFFTHPGVQTRLSFTTERTFLRTLVLAAGVVVAPGSPVRIPQLRPIGSSGMLGHVHGAAFPFHPLTKGEIDLKQTVTSLFESEDLAGVLHLLHDDRGPAGAGESEFIRGACWTGPLAGDPKPLLPG